MELKTLKDWRKKFEVLLTIDKDRKMYVETFLSHIDELKAEAIKWVKEKDMENGSEAHSDFCDFFNITEEDLTTEQEDLVNEGYDDRK